MMEATQLSQTDAKPVLILFGAPGSGKGTQAKLLSGQLDIPHISTGDILRAHVELQDQVGREVEDVLSAGCLVPDHIVYRIVEGRIAERDCSKGYILDGFPRTADQARWFDARVSGRCHNIVVIYLRVDYNRMIARLSARRYCPRCGTPYNLHSRPPQKDGVCDSDGAALVWREDDQETAIRQRILEYEEKTEPIFEYLSGNGYGVVIEDGSAGAPQEIAGRLAARLAALA